LSELRATGRRRSAAPAPVRRPRTAATGRRRAEVAASSKSSVRGAGHKAAVAAAASGLALTILLPTTAGSATPGPDVAEAAGTGVVAVSGQPVTVAAGVELQFQRTGLSSTFDPDAKLEQVMVAAGEDTKPIGSEGTLSQPMDSMKMTSPFGFRVNPVTGYAGEMHTGQDYGAACGSPVYSAAGGTVTEAGWAGGYGNRVVVDHGNGLKTTYNHLTSISAKTGDKVSRGDLLAQSGTTGNSTGCHLHFEVVVNGDMVDPKGWL
jgi:murein DD-endopeptidase MepM/ murein hydrolase activator NlpD